MSKKLDKLALTLLQYSYWDSQSATPVTSCDNCSSIGEQCHGDGQCGGDGE